MKDADFEPIVREQQSMVYSIAFYFFRNAALAEEVAQDVFLELYESRVPFASKPHIVAWLRKTVTHRCIDALRRPAMRNEVGVEELPEISTEFGDPDPLLDERLRRLVASLPAKARMIVVLRYGEDMDVEEISQIVDMPVRTVWSHLQRAVALMREKATRYLNEESNEPIR